MSATCPPRAARSIPTTISACSGRSIPRRRSGSTTSRARVKDADKLILATDPDREGEAISWHVLQVLKEKKALKSQTVERVVFNAITKQAVTEAMAHPRAIDQALVDAYLARRALDYLVGFTLSPVLWRKLPGARSAGRVQSVALRLVCRPRTRNREIRRAGILVDRRHAGDAARRDLRGAPRRRRRQEAAAPRHRLGRGSRSFQAGARNRDVHGRLGRSEAGQAATPIRRSPPRPCSRRQAASSALRPRIRCGWRSGSTKASISAARPSASSPICVPTASDRRRSDRRHARSVIEADYGREYVPPRPAPLRDQGEERAGSARSHPPDRPRPPAARDQKLSRCRSGQALRTDLAAHGGEPDGIGRARAHHRRYRGQGRAGGMLELRATGTVVKFDGFLTLYQEGRDEDPEDEESRRLPQMSAGERAGQARRSPPTSISPNRRRAIPKPRWSSAWKSSASAGPRPTPRSCKCSRTANMCGSTSAGSFRRTAAASSSPSWKASSPNTSNTISPPASKNSSI